MPDALDPTLLPAGLRLSEGDTVEAVELDAALLVDEPDDLADPVADPDPVTDPALLDDAERVDGSATDGNPQDRVSGYDGVGTRRESRERALALLYEAEQRDCSPLAAVMDGLPITPEPFAAALVRGVSEHQDEIDELISARSHNWALNRMPAVDRALLRMATFELAHTEVPVGACISEAVELAKRYSTEDSHAFVNGILARLAEDLRE